MVRASSGMLTAMSTKVIGRMIKLTALAFIFTSMARDTKASGKMICKMAGVLKVGPTDQNMKVGTKRA
jgi:hypothetical protein